MRSFAAICVTLIALSGCSEFQGPRAPTDELFFPIGVAVHPNGEYLYVANSNFDAEFRTDIGGTVVVVDAQTMEIVAESTLEIGSFAGAIALNAGRDQASDPDRLYVAVRGDNSVVALEVSADGRTLTCPHSDTTNALRCRVEDVADDAFALAMVPRPEQVRDTVDVVAVVGIEGEVSFVALDGLAVEDAEVETRGVVNGASAARVLPTSNEVWVAGRFSRRVRGLTPVFEPSRSDAQPTSGDVLSFYVSTETFIPSTVDSAEVRDIAFSADGTRGYVTTNTPSAIMVLDTTIGSGGEVRGRPIERFDVDGAPAQLVVTEERGRSVLYVTLATDEALAAYDAETGASLDTLPLGGLAYGLAHDTVNRRLYATLFDEHRVVAIDLDPASPTFRSIVGQTR